eukprot:5237459-Lingulodinium_polyedra.AAC.1
MSAEVWELRLPFEGATAFISLRHVFEWWTKLDEKKEKEKQSLAKLIHHALPWWRNALTAHGIPDSGLRLGARTTLTSDARSEVEKDIL